MFNKLLAIFLIISLQSVSFEMLMVDAGFKLNEDYIKEKLCENRAKPKLQCYGKCYLKKMQKKASEQKEATKNQIKEVQFPQLFYNQVNIVAFYAPYSRLFQIPGNNNSYIKGWPAETFRPPGRV